MQVFSSGNGLNLRDKKMQFNGSAENENLRPDSPDAEDSVAVTEEEKEEKEEKVVPEEDDGAIETDDVDEDDTEEEGSADGEVATETAATKDESSADEKASDEATAAENPAPEEELDDAEMEMELRAYDPSRPDLRWYVVHTLTGHEQKVKAGIERAIADRGMEYLVVEVLVPDEEVTTQTKKGKKTRKKIFFPGYVMVRMEITDTSWGLVRETASVTGFVSAAGNKPSPLTIDEVRIILDQIAGRKPRVKFEVELDAGEPVRITSGPFASFTGIVEEVIPDRGKVKVQVTVFGRATTVELELSQVDKTV